jgi:hypothetical protein
VSDACRQSRSHTHTNPTCYYTQHVVCSAHCATNGPG